MKSCFGIDCDYLKHDPEETYLWYNSLGEYSLICALHLRIMQGVHGSVQLDNHGYVYGSNAMEAYE